MKKRAPLLALLALLLCACTLLSACSSSPSIVNKWSTTSEGIKLTMEFKTDGTYILSESSTGLSLTGSYTVDGATLVRTVAGEQDTCTFVIDNKTLTITAADGSTVVATAA